MSDEELRIKCLELSLQDNTRSLGTVEYAMWLHNFIKGSNDATINDAIEVCREKSNLSSL